MAGSPRIKRVFIQKKDGLKTFLISWKEDMIMAVDIMSMMTIKWYQHSISRKYSCLTQVYLVTGGTGTGFRTVSTEILVSGASSWTQVGDLPTVPITGLRGASINNKIIMTGKEYLVQLFNFISIYTGGVAASKTYDYVLSYNTTDGSWTQVGNMRKPRGYHAVSVVPLDQIIDYCNF